MDLRNTVQMVLHSSTGQAAGQSQPPAASSPAVPPLSSHLSSITENKGVQKNKKTRENTRAESCVCDRCETMGSAVALDGVDATTASLLGRPPQRKACINKKKVPSAPNNLHFENTAPDLFFVSFLKAAVLQAVDLKNHRCERPLFWTHHIPPIMWVFQSKCLLQNKETR